MPGASRSPPRRAIRALSGPAQAARGDPRHRGRTGCARATEPAWDQIVASNGLALAALVARGGRREPSISASPADDHGALEDAFRRARAARADLLVTLGGASVGEHDLVQAALAREGLELGFWRVALRPGKPLMHGRLGDMLVLGLPGNPVSSIVCGLLFVVPAIRALLGDPAGRRRPQRAGDARPRPPGQ